MRQDAASRRQRVLELLAEGLSPQAAAERLGVSLRTVRGYLASPNVRETLQRLRDERLRQLAGRAVAAGEAALAVLRRIVEDETMPPAVRVQAAGKLLDAVVRLAEAADLSERVAALEDMVSERGQWHGHIA